MQYASPGNFCGECQGNPHTSLLRLVGPEIARSAEVLNAGSVGYGESESRKILNVLGNGERAGFEHKDAMTAPEPAEEEMLRECSTERSAADHDDVEGTRISLASFRPTSGRGFGSVLASASVKLLHT